MGHGPAALPGRPPWLPLCGSELAPPPAPPLGQASDPPVDTEVYCLAQGPWGRGQTAAPQHPQRQPLSLSRGAPGSRHGGGLPHQVSTPRRAPRPGSPPASLPAIFLSGASAPTPPPHPHCSPLRGFYLTLSDRSQPQNNPPPPGLVPPTLSSSPFSALFHSTPPCSFILSHLCLPSACLHGSCLSSS